MTKLSEIPDPELDLAEIIQEANHLQTSLNSEISKVGKLLSDLSFRLIDIEEEIQDIRNVQGA